MCEVTQKRGVVQGCVDFGFAAKDRHLSVHRQAPASEYYINSFDPDAQFFLLVEGEW